VQNPNNTLMQRGAPSALPDLADKALSTKEAAGYLGLSPKTLNNWRCQGNGPDFQKGPGRHGAVRYPFSALRAWRNERMRRSTSELGGGNAR
jgi:hypothetical protein